MSYHCGCRPYWTGQFTNGDRADVPGLLRGQVPAVLPALPRCASTTISS